MERIVDAPPDQSPAEPADHRALGRELDIFATAEPVGAGLPLWLPNGAAIVAELERYITEVERRAGYEHVRTPVLAKQELYEVSGHWRYFSDDVFPAMDMGSEALVLRPVLCPHHALVYRSRLRSYRELPLRLAEFGPMYRRERSGVLSGLTRVRAITLNDAHRFCAPDQVVDEVVGGLELIERAYELLGIEVDYVRLSLRDGSPKFAGDDESWAQGEAWLRAALDRRGLDFVPVAGEAAFYGPKIDIQVRDADGREVTLSTVQVDSFQPARFDLRYVAPDGSRCRPVMVHRSVLSSMERMVAYLLERHRGALPPWLAPVQVVVLPVSADQVAAARAVADACATAGIRVEVDDRDESLAARVRSARLARAPGIAVVGAREAAGGTVSARTRDGQRWPPLPVAAFVARVAAAVAARRPVLQ
jgi:threonyl-tRNA synthetase